MNIYEIRYKNARYLAGLAGGINAVAEKLEKSQPQISHLLADKPKKNIGFKIARQFEAAFNKPVDWLDRHHQELYALPKQPTQINTKTVITMTTQETALQQKVTTIGERIEIARKKLGLTQEQLGEKVGLTAQAVQRIESGKTEMPRNYLKIAKVLDVATEWLLTGNDAFTAPIAMAVAPKNDVLHDHSALLSMLKMLTYDQRKVLLNQAAELANQNQKILNELSISQPAE